VHIAVHGMHSANLECHCAMRMGLSAASDARNAVEGLLPVPELETIDSRLILTVGTRGGDRRAGTQRRPSDRHRLRRPRPAQ